MQYTASLEWHRGDAAFTVKTYDRTHTLTLGSGTSLQASSAPEFLGNAALANPEELFTASLTSCFMLTFLYVAAMNNLSLESYSATAVGKLGKNEEGKMAMTEVVITPSLVFTDGKTPDAALLQTLYKKAHDTCFISCSVKTRVTIA